MGVFRRLGEPPVPHEGHLEGITDMCLLSCEGQGFLATSSKDGSVRIWSLQGNNLGVTPPLDFPTGGAIQLTHVEVGGELKSLLAVAYESGHLVSWVGGWVGRLLRHG